MIFVRQCLIGMSLLCALVAPTTLLGQPLLLMSEDGLSQLKQRVSQDALTTQQRERFDALLRRADSLLSQPNPTVVDKTLLPPTQNPHDYLSISRYWWPDATKDDGLPWIRRDGQTNPDTQTDAVDRPRLGRMTSGVKILALSYYLTGEVKYAEKTASMVRTWFIDDATKMNPHLRFAQSVPGNPNSRRSGILDGRLIPEQVLDAITLIKPAGVWQEDDERAMNQWLREYLDWLTTSDVGIAGSQQTNNHGSWYHFQLAALGLYLDDDRVLSDAVSHTRRDLSQQMDAQGIQPHEAERTRSFFYHCFNLQALTSIALIADAGGQSFWGYETDDGRSLQQGIEYLVPYATGAEQWPHLNTGINPIDFAIALVDAKDQWPDARYDQLFTQLLEAHAGEESATAVYIELLLRHPEVLM